MLKTKKQKKLFEQFLKTGKIADYLKYKEEFGKESDFLGEYKKDGNSTKGN